MARKAFWIDNNIDLGVVSSAQLSTSLFAGTPPINVRQTTVVRMVLDLSIFSSTVAGAFGVNYFDVGIGVASQEAFFAGVFPDPNEDERPVSGWLYRCRYVVWQNGVGTQIVREIHRDIRSGRKVYDGELFLVANNTPRVGTTASYILGGCIRVLLLLP